MAFYRTHCRDLDAAALARVEAWIEQLAAHGPHRETADSNTYHPRIVDEVLQNERDWLNWFEEEGLIDVSALGAFRDRVCNYSHPAGTEDLGV